MRAAYFLGRIRRTLDFRFVSSASKIDENHILMDSRQSAVALPTACGKLAS